MPRFLTDSEYQLTQPQHMVFAGAKEIPPYVLFGDGHVSYEKQPNIGVKNDNIYTFWSTEENPTEQDKQGETAPTSRSVENDAKSKDDSFLAI